jgi:hypothetical protein
VATIHIEFAANFDGENDTLAGEDINVKLGRNPQDVVAVFKEVPRCYKHLEFAQKMS